MENQIRKTSWSNQIRKTSWSNLPQDILGIILGKLLEHPVDVIGCRTVCRNWRISRDRIRITCKDRLPSLCNISEADDRTNHIECTILDPYSRRPVFETLKSTGIHVHCSKQGWLIISTKAENSMLMYSPYCEKIIPLPSMKYEFPRFATFSGNPVSQNCQVFVFCNLNGTHWIARYCFTVDKEWNFSFVENVQAGDCRGFEYMNEQLYCLFDYGILRRYSLEDTTWTKISRNSIQITYFGEIFSLIKVEENVLVVCKISSNECSTFYFDWSSMCWVKKDLLEGSAIFVCGTTAMMRPFVGHGRVFYFDNTPRHRCKCYSFIQKSLIETHEYDWIIKWYYNPMAFVENIQEFSLNFCFR